MATQTTILLVEDEALLLQTQCLLLRREGYMVLAASDGMEALALSRNTAGKIDLLVTDVKLPRMDGFTLAEYINRERAETKIVVTSASQEAARVAADKGFCFLAKPLLPSVFREQVRRALSTDEFMPSRTALPATAYRTP
jgi:two-component system cell cycle sensor histidine kinase/response regulator CckA